MSKKSLSERTRCKVKAHFEIEFKKSFLSFSHTILHITGNRNSYLPLQRYPLKQQLYQCSCSGFKFVFNICPEANQFSAYELSVHVFFVKILPIFSNHRLANSPSSTGSLPVSIDSSRSSRLSSFSIGTPFCFPRNNLWSRNYSSTF